MMFAPMKPAKVTAILVRGDWRESMDPEEEMVEGFRDGYDLDLPDPGPNRSEAYRFGFQNGRHDNGIGKIESPHVRRKMAEDILARGNLEGKQP